MKKLKTPQQLHEELLDIQCVPLRFRDILFSLIEKGYLCRNKRSYVYTSDLCRHLGRAANNVLPKHWFDSLESELAESNWQIFIFPIVPESAYVFGPIDEESPA